MNNTKQSFGSMTYDLQEIQVYAPFTHIVEEELTKRNYLFVKHKKNHHWKDSEHTVYFFRGDLSEVIAINHKINLLDNAMSPKLNEMLCEVEKNETMWRSVLGDFDHPDNPFYR